LGIFLAEILLAGALTMSDPEQTLKRTFQWMTLAGSLLLIVFLAAVPLREHRQEWRRTQKQFFEAADLPQASNIRQILLEPLKRIDRCPTCHLGAGDAQQQHLPLPFRTHTGNLLAHHPPPRFGCTLCHAGQGRAVDRANAHARLKEANWPFPLLSLDYIESSCGHCHLAIFGESESLEGTETFQRGLRVFRQEGCLGCHKAREVGGTLGPELTVQGEKTRHEYDFSQISGEHTVSNWLYSHFKDPEMVSPGSQMLVLELDEAEIQALITFTLGMAKPDIPFEYFSLSTLRELKGERDPLPGPAAFLLICSACHGKSGEGKDYEDYRTGIPALGSEDFLSVASLDQIAFTINQGRSGRQMAAWKPRYSGLKHEEILDMAGYLKSRASVHSELHAVQNLRGDPAAGKVGYLKNCSFCHGENGRGLPVITISNPDMLAAASDSFLYRTVAMGRSNTAMPGWGRFSSEDMAHLLAFLRSWDQGSGRRLSPLPAGGDASRGEDRYHYLCSRCHGLYGQGDTGPAILNHDFLSAAPDTFLASMIANGRRGTAMFGWATAVSRQERLSLGDIADVISYLRRTTALPTPEVIYPGPSFGSAARGAAVFFTHCRGCHGSEGQGPKAPALNNQEFLNGATNGYLFATVSLGRGGTDMPPWGKGSDRYAALNLEDRQDVITFIRNWQTVVIKKQSKNRSSTLPPG
jgi:mono/diheme cytochrome c family protein